jgi:hypothetical protein
MGSDYLLVMLFRQLLLLYHEVQDIVYLVHHQLTIMSQASLQQVLLTSRISNGGTGDTLIKWW